MNNIEKFDKNHTKDILNLINDILRFGIYKYNLDLLIQKCNKLIVLIHNYERKQYLYNIISDLEQKCCNFVENDISILEIIVNIKNFLL